MSSGSPNCSGLTKMLAVTTPHSARARASKDRWPSCRAPMVGTKPTGATRPAPAGSAAAACASATRHSLAVVTVRMSDRCLLGGRRSQAGGQRGARLVAGALVLGQRVEVAAERGPITTTGRAGQRRPGAELGHVVERSPGQGQEGLEVK